MIKKLLFIFFTAPLFTQAQSIVAGDSLSAGIIYQNIKDSSVVTFPNGTVWADFDIDGDFTKDIQIYIVENVGPSWMNINKNVNSLNNLDVVAISTSTAIADTIPPGTLIDKSLNWSNAGGLKLFNYSSFGSSISTGGLF